MSGVCGAFLFVFSGIEGKENLGVRFSLLDCVLSLLFTGLHYPRGLTVPAGILRRRCSIVSNKDVTAEVTTLRGTGVPK